MNSFGASTPSQMTSVSLPAESAPVKVVNLDIVPDWGGGGYDAFIIPSYANGTAPREERTHPVQDQVTTI